MNKKLFLLLFLILSIILNSALFSQSKGFPNEKAFLQNLYSRLNADIIRNIDKKTRNQFPRQMKPEVFLNFDFGELAYFFQKTELLETINNIKLKYNLEIEDFRAKKNPPIKQKQTAKSPEEKTLPVKQKQPEPRNNSLVHLASFIFKELSVEGKAGADYFYIDPGVLMPKKEEITIKSNPYLYYDLKFRADLNFFGFDFRFKNTFKGDNYKDNYINKETTLENVKDAQTRERLFNVIGYLSPIVYDYNKTAGIYAIGEYRVFQTQAFLKSAILFKDKNQTKMLNANEDNIISMFYENYAIGPYFTRPAHGGTFKYAIGYKYSYMEAPQYIKSDNAIETISSTRHNAFIYSEWEYPDKIKLTAESNYGIATFKKPNGEKITFSFPNVKNATADQFFSNSVKNTYSYNLTDNILLQGNIGYSGYLPMMDAYYPSIGVILAAEVYLYYMSFQNSMPPWVQAIAQILASYILVKKTQKDVFYSEIVLGGQIGIKIDSAKWFK